MEQVLIFLQENGLIGYCALAFILLIIGIRKLLKFDVEKTHIKIGSPFKPFMNAITHDIEEEHKKDMEVITMKRKELEKKIMEEIQNHTDRFSESLAETNKNLNTMSFRMETLINGMKSFVEEFSNYRVETTRQDILRFAMSLRNGYVVTQEDWNNYFNKADWYNKYCEDHKIQNGVIENTMKVLDKEYREWINNSMN